MVRFTPVLCHLGPLRPKYSPQRPIPTHNQSMFFPQFELPIFIKQAKLQLYIFYSLGTAVAQCLRCCATNGKVAGSIPDDVIGIFH